MSCFYIQESPTHAGWCFPEPSDQHVKETTAPEDLWVVPENICVEPEEMQAGCTKWSRINFSTNTFYPITEPPVQFYGTAPPSIGGFYVFSIVDCN